MNKLQKKVWSYSSIGLYDDCPCAFKLKYIDGYEDKDSAFTQFGSLCHSILEDYYNGKLPKNMLDLEYMSRYDDEVNLKFPVIFGHPIDDKYYDGGLAYFSNFDDLADDYTVMGTEVELKFKLGRYDFIGFIDLLLKDKDGKYIIVDHKSKDKFKSKAEKEKYLKQLYLYAYALQQLYGYEIKELWFNMFRARKPIKEKFNQEVCDSVVRWAEVSIDLILMDDEFKKTPNDFYCRFLCGLKDNCTIE